jgi:CelD/BcsL family acetyltransferase involved in cellulose biosynthesis
VPVASTRLPIDDPAWARLVGSHPGAGPFHHPAWTTAICDAYGYDAFVLGLEDADGGLAGGLPFVRIGGRLLGRRWVSLPFTDACAPLLRPEASAADLAAELVAAQRDAGVESVEVRSDLAAGETAARGVVHELRLRDPETHFRSFTPQVRRNIRTAERSNVTIRRAEHEADLTRVYFGLHANTHRRLGVPTQPRRFFAALWERLLEPGLGFVLLAHHGRTPIAGAVFLEWNGRIVYKYGASDRRHWALRPNNLLFWECIRQACESGARVLDLGRSDAGSHGLRAFKSGFGAEETELRYTTLGPARASRLALAERCAAPVIRTAPTWLGRGLGKVFYRFAA